ncbi:MAG: hypothetical protein JYX80_13710 [Candidatus Scalindua sediminis]|nr:hypothetical protein [Candidatus Scalindua sediminis]
MLRNYTIYLIGFTSFVFIAFSTFFFSHITFATDDSVVEKQKKYEASKENAQAESEHTSTTLSGKIVETMNSGGYTYILIEKDGEKTWVCATET